MLKIFFWIKAILRWTQPWQVF